MNLDALLASSASLVIDTPLKRPAATPLERFAARCHVICSLSINGSGPKGERNGNNTKTQRPSLVSVSWSRRPKQSGRARCLLCLFCAWRRHLGAPRRAPGLPPLPFVCLSTPLGRPTARARLASSAFRVLVTVFVGAPRSSLVWFGRRRLRDAAVAAAAGVGGSNTCHGTDNNSSKQTTTSAGREAAAANSSSKPQQRHQQQHDNSSNKRQRQQRQQKLQRQRQPQQHHHQSSSSTSSSSSSSLSSRARDRSLSSSSIANGAEKATRRGRRCSCGPSMAARGA